mgnify:FL=1
MIVFLQSYLFDPHLPYYGKTLSIDLDELTDNVTVLVRIALKLLEQLYKASVMYKKYRMMLIK